MGELHLDIYVERIRREYNVEVEVGAAKVNYREAPTQAAEFNTTHRKQTGGSGQYAHIVGRLDVLPDDAEENFLFEEKVVGGRIPKQYIPAVEKGFRSMLAKGPIAGIRWSVWRCTSRTARTTRSTVPTWRSRSAPRRRCARRFPNTKPVLLEPVMKIEIECPSQFQGSVVGNLTSRRGIVHCHRGPRRRRPHRGRSAAGRNVRLFDRPAEHDAGPRHLHDGIRQRLPKSIEEESHRTEKRPIGRGNVDRDVGRGTRIF